MRTPQFLKYLLSGIFGKKASQSEEAIANLQPYLDYYRVIEEHGVDSWQSVGVRYEQRDSPDFLKFADKLDQTVRINTGPDYSHSHTHWPFPPESPSPYL